MTGNRFALDTNIVSAWLKGEGTIADKIDAAESVFLPIIVITERYPLLSIDEDTNIRLHQNGPPEKRKADSRK